MKNTTKRILSLTVAAALLFPSGPISVQAGDLQNNPDGQTVLPMEETGDAGRTDTPSGDPSLQQPSQEEPNGNDAKESNPPETDTPGADTPGTGTPEPAVSKEEAEDASRETTEPSEGEEDTSSPSDQEIQDAALIEQIKKSKGHFTETKVISKKKFSLTWDKIKGADGYYIKRKIAGGTWETLKKIKGAENTTFIDSGINTKNIYYYIVKAYIERNGKKAVGISSDSLKMKYVAPPTLNTEIAPDGIQLRWNRPDKAAGYYVYRRAAAKEKWTKIYTITQPGEISWRDTSAKNGNLYSYAVSTYSGHAESALSNAKTYSKITVPKVNSLTRNSSTAMTVAWKTNASCSGYQIQYSRNSMFSGVKKVTLSGSDISAYTLSGLAANQNYYVRVRAYKKRDGGTYYSAWSVSGNVKAIKNAKTTIMKKGKKKFELRSFAKQQMFQYDVLQGSCTDGIYSYYLLLNKSNYYSKIVKVEHKTRNIVLVSNPMYVGHGNDMTYNADKNCIVVAHTAGSDPKALTCINPNNLNVISTRHITIPAKLAGGTTLDAQAVTAFTGIAYSKDRRQYVALVSRNYNFVILDAEMNPIQYVKASKKNDYMIQGIDVTKDYILVAASPKYASQAYNIITVYDWDGNYISKINVKKGYEIESIYHIGSKYYGSFYRSYYKTYYKKVVKKVKVKGKIKKKKVKQKYSKFMRDNYVYRISGI